MLTCTFSMVGLLAIASPSSTTGFADDFDDGILSEDWTITLIDANGWTSTEADGYLTVSDIDPAVINHASFGTWARVDLHHELEPVQDFVMTFNAGWDSANSNAAMQRVLASVLDADGGLIARIGYNDEKISFPGSISAELIGDSFASAHDLPLAGDAIFGIERDDDELRLYWDDVEVLSGIDVRDAAAIRIEFWYYAYDGSAGVSLFGTETVDRISIACPCDADLNGDGTVNAADLAVLLAFWGPVGAFPEADLDGDGIISAADLAALLAAWGMCP